MAQEECAIEMQEVLQRTEIRAQERHDANQWNENRWMDIVEAIGEK
jgi:hypothetical protein